MVGLYRETDHVVWALIQGNKYQCCVVVWTV